MTPTAPRPRPPAPATLDRSGLLAVDKPAGPTSHDVVALVRRHLGAPGAGHLGTLDPAATGLLLVAVGAATRCTTVWQAGEKTYEATVCFGVVTESQDLQGRILERRQVTAGEPEIRAAAAGLTGEIEQVPPMVSAVRVGGRRLHELARQGVTVTRAPRRVRVEEWTWLEFALPEARFRVRCSGGTYVRTLAHDLGARLGCGAALVALRRTRSAPFDLSRSVTVPEIRSLDPGETWSRGGIPLARALAHLPGVVLDSAERSRVGHGNPVPRPAAEAVARPASPGAVVLSDPEGAPLGLAEWRSDARDPGLAWLQPRVIFPWAVCEGRG